MHLNTLSACQNFLETHDAAAIAAQLRKDLDLCRANNNAFPSLLIHCIPAARIGEISRALCGEVKMPMSVARMRYHNIVEQIKAHLISLERNGTEYPKIPAHLVPSDEELHATLKVLHYLQISKVAPQLSLNTPFREVVSIVAGQLAAAPEMREATPPPNRRQKRCYICRYSLTSAHRLYPSLCNPCGEFNIAESSLSLPENLDLKGKTAVVTGGRINLGYHTALRLLRCGASVVVSTRYPLDAEMRYLKEPDSEVWRERLRVVGADFRAANDVFALVEAIKQCLRTWGTDKLDILINNAAQTLTDPIEKESAAIRREQQLLGESFGGQLIASSTYMPRIRGAGQFKTHREALEAGSNGGDGTEVSTTVVEAKKSSWTQKVHEIPYEDVISAYSVNSFVPLILLRELLPIMRRLQGGTGPAGHIINVSSREALPEHKPEHSAKAGHHVHTNMSKAALHMLTETEAGEAWTRYRVAVNSVDPGYMSADPMWMEKLGLGEGTCPIGWEDGAGRVLWVVAKAEMGVVIRGRFLKHFESIEAGR
jgi:NAD(P)-dependent dehydrogenase (short-subunit alcohol dehydrogenase family)